MDRVLLDGTTLMSATRLLNGQDPPTALNVYSLSLLVESLILNTELIVLNTSPEDDRLTQAALAFGDAVWVESRSTDDVVERYVEMHGLAADDPKQSPVASGGAWHAEFFGRRRSRDESDFAPDPTGGL